MSKELSARISDLLVEEHQHRLEQARLQALGGNIVCCRYAFYAPLTYEYVCLNVSENHRAFIGKFVQTEAWREIVSEITSKAYIGPIDFGELLYYRDTRGVLCLTVLESFDRQVDTLSLPHFGEACAIFFDTDSITNWTELSTYLVDKLKPSTINQNVVFFDEFPAILLRINGSLELHLKDFNEIVVEQVLPIHYFSRKPRSYEDRIAFTCGVVTTEKCQGFSEKLINNSLSCSTLKEKIQTRSGERKGTLLQLHHPSQRLISRR